MLTLQDLAAGIREITAEDPPIVRVWQHSVGFSVYVEAHGHQFLFGIGDPADSPDQDVTGGTLNWEKTLREALDTEPEYGIATGSDTWTRAQILDKIREIIEYA